MDRLILGDNQFFGINHMSEDRALDRARMFADTAAIIELIDAAYDCGIRGFMFSTHAAVADICDHFRANPDRYAELRLYPVLPYARKYAEAVASKGVFGAIGQFAAGGAVGTVARGGWALATQDPTGLMKLLVDAEMKMFRHLRLGAVLLQNVVTDLLLGLGLKDVFRAFASYVRQRYSVEPGFITMNLPAMVDLLLDCGIENPIVCGAVNRIGHFMNPSQAECELAIRTRPFRPMAMAIFASGSVPPREAIEYVRRQEKVQAVVFGASTRAHVEQTKAMLERAVAFGEEVQR